MVISDVESFGIMSELFVLYDIKKHKNLLIFNGK